MLIYGDANSVALSNYNPSLPIKVFAHGWGGSGNGGTSRRVKDGMNSFVILYSNRK